MRFWSLPKARDADLSIDGAGQFQASLERVAQTSAGIEEEARAGWMRLAASVGYFPEKYGEGLLRLAFDILGRKPVAPAVFTNHQIITPDNVDQFDPNDSLLSRS